MKDLQESFSPPDKSKFRLAPDELRNCRHRIARFKPMTPAAELAALRVRLDEMQLQRTSQIDGAQVSDCLKYINELVLMNFPPRMT